MEILKAGSTTIVYPEMRSRRLGTVCILALLFLIAETLMIRELAQEDRAYFVRFETVQNKGQPGRRCIVRDAAGNERELERGDDKLAGAEPGDPVYKSPGSFDYRRLPPGAAFPEPRWFRFGYQDLVFPVVVGLGLILVALGNAFNAFRRFVFDREAGKLRLQRPMPWGYHVTMEQPLKWVRGCVIKEGKYRTVGWDVMLVGETGEFHIGLLGSEHEARDRAAELDDVMPMLDLKP